MGNYRKEVTELSKTVINSTALWHSADTDPSKIDPRLSPKKFSNVDDQSINLSILAEKLPPTTSDIRPY